VRVRFTTLAHASRSRRESTGLLASVPFLGSASHAATWSDGPPKSAALITFPSGPSRSTSHLPAVGGCQVTIVADRTSAVGEDLISRFCDEPPGMRCGNPAG